MEATSTMATPAPSFPRMIRKDSCKVSTSPHLYLGSVFEEMYSATFLRREVVCPCARVCITQAVPLVSRAGRLSPSLCWRTCWSLSLHSTDTLQADPVSVRCTGSARHKRGKNLFLNFTLYAWLKCELPLIGERCEFFQRLPNNSPKKFRMDVFLAVLKIKADSNYSRLIWLKYA